METDFANVVKFMPVYDFSTYAPPPFSEQRAPACVTTVHVEGFTYEVIFSTSEDGPHVDMVIYYWCQGVKHDEFVDCKVKKMKFARMQ